VVLKELYSVLKRETVWGIESKSRYSMGFDRSKDYSIIVNEAKAITKYLSRDGLIAR